MPSPAAAPHAKIQTVDIQFLSSFLAQRDPGLPQPRQIRQIRRMRYGAALQTCNRAGFETGPMTARGRDARDSDLLRLHVLHLS